MGGGARGGAGPRGGAGRGLEPGRQSLATHTASDLDLIQVEGSELSGFKPLSPLPDRRPVQGRQLSVLANLTPCMTRGSFIT